MAPQALLVVHVVLVQAVRRAPWYIPHDGDDGDIALQPHPRMVTIRACIKLAVNGFSGSNSGFWGLLIVT